MPSEKSTYNKIFTILEIAKSSKVKDRQTLIVLTKELNQPVYFSRKYNEEKDDYISEFSTDIVNRIISICEKLKFFDGNGITELGRSALKRKNFDFVLAKQIIEYFSEKNIKLSVLNSIINSFLKEKIPVMPTANAIYKEASFKEETISLILFSKFITLLAHCNYAKSSQAKIYLEFKTE